MNKHHYAILSALMLGAAAGAADAPAPAPTTAMAAAPATTPAAMPGKRKPCEELKAEMAARMDAKGVKSYTLRIVTPEEAAAATDEKVVGSCDGGEHRILYKRG